MTTALNQTVKRLADGTPVGNSVLETRLNALFNGLETLSNNLGEIQATRAKVQASCDKNEKEWRHFVKTW